MGNYTVVQDCDVANGGGNTAYMFLAYNNDYVLAEDNTINNLGYGISPKDTNNYWWIRGNVCTNCPLGSVQLQGYVEGGNMVVEYNRMDQSAASSALSINANGAIEDGPLYIHRNTIYDRKIFVRGESIADLFNFRRNVLINDNGLEADKDGNLARIDIASTNANISFEENISEPTANEATTIDSNGLLLDSYLTANSLTRGTRGHEIA